MTYSYELDPNSSAVSLKRTPASKLRTGLMVSAALVGLVGLAIDNGGLFSPRAAHAAMSSAQETTHAQYPSFSDLVEAVGPAVVSIRVKAAASVNSGRHEFGFGDIPRGHPLERFMRPFGEKRFERHGRGGNGRSLRVSQGSGFFVSADGFLVTNNHVVDKGERVTVVMSDGAEHEAKVIGTDPKTDLALLKVSRDEPFEFVEFANQDIRVGEWVVAVGNPFGLGGTVTAGIVSARGRDIGASDYDDFIQIDAPINRGNSGGPTFNQAGKVVGVNTAIFSPSGGSVGIGFAIPAKTAQLIIADLKDDGKIVRGWLGVQIQPVSKDIADGLGLAERKGALIVDVHNESPAARAGFQSGDTILEIGGNLVASPRDLSRKVAMIMPGTDTDVVVWRRGKTVSLSVRLGQLPITNASLSSNDPTSVDIAPNLGLVLGSTPADRDGVIIVDIDPDGIAASKGLRPGDVILSINNNRVDSVDGVAAQLKITEKAGLCAALLKVLSGNQQRFVAIPFIKG